MNEIRNEFNRIKGRLWIQYKFMDRFGLLDQYWVLVVNIQGGNR